MLAIDKQYKLIVSNNSNILENILKYIECEFNISDSILYNNCKYYIRKTLESIKANNNKAVRLRIERRKIREDLEDLEQAFVKVQSTDVIGEGKNTGGRPNREEERQIKKISLREQLRALVVESQLVEKALKDCNELIASFIALIPRSQYVAILMMTYINCMSNTEISYELSCGTEFINIARIRGIVDLTEILKLKLENIEASKKLLHLFE